MASMTESSSPSYEDKKGIQVVCAGLGRTGTLSLTDALEILGYKPYHYIDFHHDAQWAELARGERSADSVIDMIVQDGYDATLENPTCEIYTDILKRYPNAKVILTVRDSPQAFVKSWKLLFETMIITEQRFSWKFPSFFGYIPLFWNLKQIRHFMGTTHLGLNPGELTHGWRDRDDDDDWLAEQYNRHNDHVKSHVPKQENLLVFNVKEGWEPLCRFLGKPVPKNDEPFPHSQVNNASALQQLRRIFLIVVYGWIPSLLLTAGSAAFCYYHFGGNGLRLRSSGDKSCLKM